MGIMAYGITYKKWIKLHTNLATAIFHRVTVSLKGQRTGQRSVFLSGGGGGHYEKGHLQRATLKRKYMIFEQWYIPLH